MSPPEGPRPPATPWDRPVKTSRGKAYVADLKHLRGSAIWKQRLASYRKDHRSLEIIEQTIQQNFEYHYLILEDDSGTVRDIQPFFLHTQDLMAGLGPRMQRLARIIRKVVPRFLTLRTLMVGSPACEGHLASDAEDARWCAAAMHEALESLGRIYRASLVVLKEFPSAHREGLSCFASDGYARIASMPHATLELAFENFEQHMQQQLSRSFRKNLRRKFRDAERFGPLEMQVANDIAPWVDEVYPLYLQVYERADLKFEKLTKEYLCRMGTECPDRSRFFIWRLSGRAVAFSVCSIHEDAIWDEYLGLDYEVALDLHLYFVTFRDLINWACRQGLKRYYTTALSYDPKLHLRCDLAPVDLYVRHTNPLLNVLFRPLVKLLQPTRSDPAIAKFANADQL